MWDIKKQEKNSKFPKTTETEMVLVEKNCREVNGIRKDDGGGMQTLVGGVVLKYFLIIYFI